MEIQLAGIALGAIGLFVSFASGLGAGVKFVLFYIAFLLVLSWALTFVARRQQHILLPVPPDAVADAVRANFSGVGWKEVDGRGLLNFQARGLGIGSYGSKRPVISVDIEDLNDGTTGVGIWTSSWHSKYGIMALCDRVVSKKFWLERKLNELSNSVVSGPNYHGPTIQSAPGRSGPPQSTSEDDKATLADPGLPLNDSRQLAHVLLTSVGVAYLMYGPGDAASCFRAFTAVAPALLETESQGSDFMAKFRGTPGMYLLCFEGQFGSAIAVCVSPEADSDFSINEIAMRLRNIQQPWQWGIGTIGGRVPAGFARIVDSSNVVELSTLPGLEHLQLTVPPELQANLRKAGWEEVPPGGGFKIDVSVAADRTLAVFFSPYNAGSFALMTPLDKDEYVPAEVRARSFGRYSLDTVGDMAVLSLRYPSSEPVPYAATLSAEARALATYTHQQFGGPQQSPHIPPPIIPTQKIRTGPTPTPPPYSPPSHAQSATQSYSPATGNAPRFGYDANRPGVARGYDASAGLGRRDVRPWLIGGAVVAVLVVIAAMALSRSGGKPTASVTDGDSPLTSVASTNNISVCPSPPALQSQSVTVSSNGLTVVTQISPSCSSGDILSNNRFRVTAVDATGKDVAAGLFDLSSNPIAVASSGMSVELIFPAGTYWRTPDSIAGNLKLTAYKDGSDGSASGTTSVSSLTATGAGTPESGNPEGAAQSALADIAAADRSYIDANLLDRWQPQLSSKRPGLVADGTTWSTNDIVRDHMQLRQRFPGARLVWSGDWPVFSDPDWWVTVAGVPFGSGEDANAWCANQGFDADHCFAKILSHTLGTSDTTLTRQ